MKQCPNCNSSFKTKDSRQKTCSKTCAKARADVRRAPIETASFKLPEPEDLPAPYAKRVHDMWAALVDGNSHTRIA